MPLWSRQGTVMRRMAKEEGRIQGYSEISKYYKAEVRRIFTNNQKDQNLYRFLQEKYTLLYFWPDRTNWNEHWEDWFDDGRSQPHHTITLTDKKGTKTGPKLTCSLADWDVFQAKAYAPGAKKARATPAVYNGGLDAGLMGTADATSSSTTDLRTTTSTTGGANSASNYVPSLQEMTAKPQGPTSWPDTQAPYDKTRDYSSPRSASEYSMQSFMASKSQEHVTLPYSQAKTEEHPERSMLRMKAKALKDLPKFQGSPSKSKAYIEKAASKSKDSTFFEDPNIKTENRPKNTLDLPNFLPASRSSRLKTEGHDQDSAKLLRPKSSTFLSDHQTQYIVIEDDDDDVSSASVPATKSKASSKTPATITPKADRSTLTLGSFKNSSSNKRQPAQYLTLGTFKCTSPKKNTRGAKENAAISEVDTTNKSTAPSVRSSKANRKISTSVDSSIPVIIISDEDDDSFVAELSIKNATKFVADRERLQARAYVPKMVSPKKPTAAMFFFDDPSQPENSPVKSDLEIEVDQFLDDLEAELIAKWNTSQYIEDGMSDGQASAGGVNIEHEDTNMDSSMMDTGAVENVVRSGLNQ